MPTVTFQHRMRKSYSVTIGGNVRYRNDRRPHVETDQTDLTGKTFALGARHERNLGKNVAVFYDVVGVTNRGAPAHLTVYFGPAQDAKDY